MQGLDLSKAQESSRFVFVDYLTQSLSDNRQPLAELEKTVTEAREKLQKSSERRVVLILDSPDVLLATNSATAQELDAVTLKLRNLVHSTFLTCSVDLPLLAAATQTPGSASLPIEVESARFVFQQAHNARYVMGVRELTTGAARDVSGVLLVTRSACVYDLDENEQLEVREMEALYLVQRDGNVRVFERGADAT